MSFDDDVGVFVHPGSGVGAGVGAAEMLADPEVGSALADWMVPAMDMNVASRSVNRILGAVTTDPEATGRPGALRTRPWWRGGKIGGMVPEDVYAVARLVPPGRVVSYGDIAALFDASPRQVGRFLSGCGDTGVPWWRVTDASGHLPRHLILEAIAHWRAEGTPCRLDGSGVLIGRARADLPDLADAAERKLGTLPGLRGRVVEPHERPVGD